MKDFLLGAVVLACMGFAFYVEWVSREHASDFTHGIAAAAMFLGVGCAIPMRFKRAVDTARRVRLPFMDRRKTRRPHGPERRGDGEA